MITRKNIWIPVFCLMLTLLPSALSGLFEYGSTFRDWRGRSAWEAGEYDSAVEWFEANEDPQDSRTLYNLGCALYMRQNWEEAEKKFTAAANDTKFSNREDAWYNLGCALYRQQRFLEARTAFGNALLISPENDDARWNFELCGTFLNSLRIEVTDSLSGEVVPHASIQAVDQAIQPRLTDRSGQCLFSKSFVGGDVELSIDARGYLRKTITVSIREDHQLLEVELKPALRCRGRVTDLETGKAIAGASVSVKDMKNMQALTDSAGWWSAGGFDSKDYEFTVQAHRYVKQQIDVPVTMDDTRIDFALKPALHLMGTVVDSLTGQPVPFATVRAEDVGSTTTDQKGEYELWGFDRKTYRMNVIAPGYALNQKEVTVTPSDSVAAWELSPEIVLSGKVVDSETDEPILDAVVGVRSVPVDSVRTSQSGAWELRNLGKGDYRLTASALHYKRVEIAFPLSEENNRLEIPLELWIVVQGTITDAETGDPIEGAKVEIPGTDIKPGTSKKDGTYRVEGFKETTYQFKVTAQGYRPLEKNIAVSKENRIHHFQLEKEDPNENQQQQQQQQQNQDQQNQEEKKDEEQQQNQQQQQQNQDQQQQQQQKQQQQKGGANPEEVKKQQAERLLQLLMSREKNELKKQQKKSDDTKNLKGKYW